MVGIGSDGMHTSVLRELLTVTARPPLSTLTHHRSRGRLCTIANGHKLLTASRRARSMEGNTVQPASPQCIRKLWSEFFSKLYLLWEWGIHSSEMPSYLNDSMVVISALNQHSKLIVELAGRERTWHWFLDAKQGSRISILFSAMRNHNEIGKKFMSAMLEQRWLYFQVVHSYY